MWMVLSPMSDISDNDKLVWKRRKNLADQACAKLPDLRWGPGHIVLDDLNLDDRSILWCLANMDTPLKEEHMTPEIMEKTWDTLVLMLFMGRLSDNHDYGDLV